ncbi:hypothetical protein ACQKWADRAFT_291331 [Trichoderma austrokoningii]
MPPAEAEAEERGELQILAGAKEMFRRLFTFRRATPMSSEAVPEEDFTHISRPDGLNVPSAPPNSPSSTSLVEITLPSLLVPTLQVQLSKTLTAYSRFIGDEDYDSDEFNDSTISDGNAVMISRSGSSRPASGASRRGSRQRRGGKEKRAANDRKAGDTSLLDADQQVDDDDDVVVEKVTATKITAYAAAAALIAVPGKDKQKENQQPPRPKLASTTVAADKDERKENQKPRGNQLEELSRKLTDIAITPAVPAASKKLETPSEEIDPEIITDMSSVDPAVVAEHAMHHGFMEEALDMARLALVTNETPVGCVIVYKGEVIAKGMNATNVTRNGTRHAEFMAISALFSVPAKDAPRTTCLKPKVPPKVPEGKENDPAYAQEWRSPDEGNEDGSKGHLYPYGQKTTSMERLHRDIMKECTLYVTVEPCIMCASLLRQLQIKKVYFGAVNDKFGGCGGVFNIHANGLPAGSTDRVQAEPKRYQFPDGGGSLGVSYPRGGGHGSNVEPGFEIEGGWSRDEAVGLLRRFYVQENGRAPVPRKKEGRAARLAAMMEQEATGAASSAGEADAATTDAVTTDAATDADAATTDAVATDAATTGAADDGSADADFVDAVTSQDVDMDAKGKEAA